MTALQPERQTFDEGLKNLTRENRYLTAGKEEKDLPTSDETRQGVEQNATLVSDLKIKENEGKTRNSLGGWVIATFCGSIAALVLCGCGLAAFSDDTHMKTFVSFVQVVGTLLSGAVGFVLGHYFTSKSAR